MRPVWVIGSGGHAKIVIDTLRATGAFEVVGALDEDPRRLDSEILGVQVQGDLSPWSLDRLGVERAVIAIGSNRVRAAVARRLDGRLAWETPVHPQACVADGVRIGEGTVVFAGAVVQPGAVIGRHVILNTACSVDHDNTIDDFGQIAPGSHLAGCVRVGEGAFLGTGSCVIPGCSVGAWATVGAGGVVTRDVPPGVTAKGVPARWPSPQP